MAPLAIVLCLSLAGWQWQRGTAKRARIAQIQAAGEAAPELLTAARPPPADGVQRVVALGEYRAGRQLLQDGQSHGGRPGYHVWTPMRLADGGGLVIVNRGWVPQPPEDVDLSAPSAAQSIAGFWRALPEPALRLDTGGCNPGAPFPQVVVYPTAEELGCLLGEPVAAGVLLLDPNSPGGYVREWATPGLPPERHYAYAAQWAALAVLIGVLFVALSLRRLPGIREQT